MRSGLRKPGLGTSAAPWLRPALGAGAFVVCVMLMRDRFAGIDPAEVLALVGAIRPERWLLALVLTAGSFGAIGLYDVAIHRWLGTRVSPRHAALSGATAIAVSQIVGMGLVTGTLARWYLLSDLVLERAAQLTAVVAASFLAALLVSLAATGFVAGLPDHAPVWLLPLGTGVAIALPLLSLAQPRCLPFALPSLRLMGGILGATLADTVLAALALWILLPETTDLSPAALVATFMISLGAGLISGSPAGAGAFELTLLWLLPTVPEADLLAAILAFRLVYFGLPAILGGVAMVALRARPLGRTLEAPPAPPLSTAPRAEAALVRQGELAWQAAGPGHIVVGDTGQCLIALGDPVAHPDDVSSTLSCLAATARGAGLCAAFYKCGARTAAQARRLGWRVVHVADEALLAPAAFTTATPDRARLRRKLRGAAKAGIAVSFVPRGSLLPLPAMSDVAASWATARGGERGFSMGRWSPDYVAGQHVALAHKDGRLVAFATFHAAPHEWTLDLLRTVPDAPDGTMHALVAAAIAAASDAGCPRLSLAALPSPRTTDLAARLPGRLAAPDGLRQFKSAFAPRYEPLYLTAPGPVALGLATLDILRRVMRPVPLAGRADEDLDTERELAPSSP